MTTQEDVEAFLAHHGVKGMHWGVRKDREDSESHDGKKETTSSSKAWTPKNEQELKRAYQAVPLAHRTPKEAAKNFAENQKKFQAKFEPPSEAKSGHHLTDRQKKALVIGAGVAAIGGLAALAYYSKKNDSGISLPSSRVLPGEHISVSNFEKQVHKSELDFWGSSDFSTRASFERPETTIPAGHVFHRLSRDAEDKFGNATYTSGNLDDFNRYVIRQSGFDSKELIGKQYHVTFSAKEPIKIPSLTTAVEILRQSMSEGRQTEATHQEALKLYNAMSGGSWDISGGNKFVQALKAKGYDGIFDEMDSGVVSDNPLVIFSSDKMSDKVAKELKDSDVVSAAKNLKELTHRKTLSMAAGGLMEDVSENVEEFLAHHGIKGMRWGVRNASSRAEDNLALRQRIVEKNTAKATAKYGDRLTDEDRAEIQRQADKKVTRHIAEVGALKVAAVLVGGKAIHGKMPLSVALKEPAIAKVGEAAAVLYLAGKVGASSYHDIKDFKAESKALRG
jgi:hypothetical protein